MFKQSISERAWAGIVDCVRIFFSIEIGRINHPRIYCHTNLLFIKRKVKDTLLTLCHDLQKKDPK